MMISRDMREQILIKIRELAKANGGQPPGRRSFTSETGIPESAWFGVYWARWGDALTEAGFTPNLKNEKFDEQFVLAKLAKVCRHYGKVPVPMEMRLYKKIDADFPNYKTFLTSFGGKDGLVRRLREWASNNEGYEDIVAMVGDEAVSPESKNISNTPEGFVYLIHSGAHYKIGRSDEIERRVKEIRVALPEAAKLLHTIRTDDPSGIEAYWLKRFADRRANGEWFKLRPSDVAAFKRRKYQ